MTTKVDKSVLVSVPVSTAYNQWTQFEDFPQFMAGVESVNQHQRGSAGVGCRDRRRTPSMASEDLGTGS